MRIYRAALSSARRDSWGGGDGDDDRRSSRLDVEELLCYGASVLGWVCGCAADGTLDVCLFISN